MTNQDIKDYRLHLGLSQEDFARLLGVKLQSVSRWELGKGNPGLRAKREIRKLTLKMTSKVGVKNTALNVNLARE